MPIHYNENKVCFKELASIVARLSIDIKQRVLEGVPYVTLCKTIDYSSRTTLITPLDDPLVGMATGPIPCKSAGLSSGRG
jgi:hypothetical protein